MTDLTTSAALTAHARGWTPIPLKPALKKPLLLDWTETAYTAPQDVTATFTRAARDRAVAGLGRLNLGLALGARHGGLVDIDIDNPKALALAADLLPETAMRSGRASNPGSHFWYAVEDYDPGIHAYTLPDRSVIIEYRAGGGQSAIPPSRHPDGENYHWSGEALGGETGPRTLSAEGGVKLHASVISIAILINLADNWPRKGSRHAAFLPLVGGLLRDELPDGTPSLHPLWDQNIEGIIRGLVNLTNDGDGARTRIAEAVTTTRKRILRGDKVQGWPTLASIIGDEHVTQVRKYVEEIEEMGGVPRAKRSTKQAPAEEWWSDEGASAALRVVDDEERAPGLTPEERAVQLALMDPKDRDPLSERENEWEQVDLLPYLKGGVKPPETGLLFTTALNEDTGQREALHGLLYIGRVNSLYGSGGSGKTLVALKIAADVMADGDNVLMIDMEDEPHGTLDRLISSGVDPDLIAKRFGYIRPEYHPLSSMQRDRWGDAQVTDTGRESTDALTRSLNLRDPSLIIIDGTTTLYRIHGLDTNASNGTDLIGGWLRRLTDNGNRTVILIDHTGKTASPSSDPIGSQHKIAMIQGAALHVYATTKPRRGHRTTASIYLGKDRPGSVAEHSVDGEALKCAEVIFDSTGKHLQITVETPDPSKTRVDFTDDDRAAIEEVLRDHYPAWLTRSQILTVMDKAMGYKKWGNRIEPMLDSNVIEKRGLSRDRAYRLVPSVNDNVGASTKSRQPSTD